MVAAGKRKLKELHFMHCPKCGLKLCIADYDMVEVNVCGGFKDLWLEANELDRILESKQ